MSKPQATCYTRDALRPLMGQVDCTALAAEFDMTPRHMRMTLHDGGSVSLQLAERVAALVKRPLTELFSVQRIDEATVAATAPAARLLRGPTVDFKP